MIPILARIANQISVNLRRVQGDFLLIQKKVSSVENFGKEYGYVYCAVTQKCGHYTKTMLQII
jgi:hypothetical protein